MTGSDRPRLLVIGSYPGWDAGPMRRDYEATELPEADAIADLPPDLRGAIRAMAFRAHGDLTAEHMDLLPALGIVANFGVGYEAIDVAAAEARGIRVTNTPDVLNDDVADLAVAMLIAQARQMLQGDAHVRSGAWEGGALPLNRTVTGRRVGIMGLGRIGRAIAERLAAFKTEIHYHSRSEKMTPGWTYHDDPEDMARAVDDMVVALKGGQDTEDYVSAAIIAALGPDGVLVNISRGTTVDEAALIAALEDGTIRGAALDVFRGEPQIDPQFLKLENVLLQPHQASGTIETRQTMGRLQRENIDAFLAGRDLPSPVN